MSDKEKLLAFGFDESEADIVIRLAKDKKLSAFQLTRQALRLYQATVEPVLDIGPSLNIVDD